MVLKIRTFEEGKINYNPVILSEIEYFGSEFIAHPISLNKLISSILEDDNTTISSPIKDVSGKTVYQGDIIEFKDGPNDPYPCLEEVEFRWETFEFKVFGGFELLELDGKCKIVGNKFENPELLD